MSDVFNLAIVFKVNIAYSLVCPSFTTDSPYVVVITSLVSSSSSTSIN